MTIDVDTGRLGQEAGTLSGQGPPLSHARDELGSAAGTAIGSCGSVNDEGLRSALQRLSEAWGYEVAAIGSDISATSSVMTALAQAYAQLDSQGATAINGGQL
jgi:hypothetical protein